MATQTYVMALQAINSIVLRSSQVINLMFFQVQYFCGGFARDHWMTSTIRELDGAEEAHAHTSFEVSSVTQFHSVTNTSTTRLLLILDTFKLFLRDEPLIRIRNVQWRPVKEIVVLSVKYSQLCITRAN
jgi:hypothetical protein